MTNIETSINDGNGSLRAVADNNNNNNRSSSSSSSYNNNTPITLYANERPQQQQHEPNEERRHQRHEKQQLDRHHHHHEQQQQHNEQQWQKQQQCELEYERDDGKMYERVTVICRCCLLEEHESPANYLPLDTVAAFITADTKPTTPTATTATANIDKDNDSSAQQTITTTTLAQQTPTLLDCLKMCAHIGADENLPQHICLDCSQALEACCEFIRCVQNADKILRGKLQKTLEQQKVPKDEAAFTSTTHYERQHLLSPPTSIPTSPRSELNDRISVQAIDIDLNNLFEQNSKGCFKATRNLLKEVVEEEQEQEEGVYLRESAEICRKKAKIVTTVDQGDCLVNAAVDDDDGIIEQYSEEDLLSDRETSAHKSPIEASTNCVDTEVESACSVVRSFDSGIEIDDDPYSLLPEHHIKQQQQKQEEATKQQHHQQHYQHQQQQHQHHQHYQQQQKLVRDSHHETLPSDYINETENSSCYLASYHNNTYVVASSLQQRLQQFHTSPVNTAVHKCGFCVYACRTKEQLTKHLVQHLGPTRYNCNMCKFRCRFRYFLRKHKRLAHDVYESLYADLTTVIDRNTLLRTTTYSETYTKYQCTTCEHYLMNLEALQQHIEMHKVELYECTICPYNDIIRENVLEHLAAEHNVLVDVSVVAQYIPLKNPLQSIHGYRSRNILERKKSLPLDSLPRLTAKIKKHGKHLCQFCGKCFERLFHLMKHEYKVHNISVGHDGLESKFMKKSSPKHAQLQYQRHRKAAQSERRFHCYQCREIFKTASVLMKHRQSVHGENVKFECDICGAEFMFNFELKYHRRTHEVNEQQQQQQQHQTVSKKLFVGGARKCSESSQTSDRASNNMSAGSVGGIPPQTAPTNLFANSNNTASQPLRTATETSQDFSVTDGRMQIDVAAEHPPTILLASTTTTTDSSSPNATNLTPMSPLAMSSALETSTATSLISSQPSMPVESTKPTEDHRQPTHQPTLPMDVAPIQAEPPCLSFDLFDDSQLYLNDFDLDLLVC